MIKMTHYLYVLSTWSLVAEDALEIVRAEFTGRLTYDWRIASTDYGGAGRLSREDLAFYYARLKHTTGQTMNLGWWRECYDWLVPDRVAVAARRSGACGNEVRLALALAGLKRGEDITDIDTALSIASDASAIDRAVLRTAYEHPETLVELYESTRAFSQTGVSLRPAFVLENELGDMVVLSGIWTPGPLRSAIAALLADDESHDAFIARTPRSNFMRPSS